MKIWKTPAAILIGILFVGCAAPGAQMGDPVQAIQSQLPLAGDGIIAANRVNVFSGDGKVHAKDIPQLALSVARYGPGGAPASEWEDKELHPLMLKTAYVEDVWLVLGESSIRVISLDEDKRAYSQEMYVPYKIISSTEVATFGVQKNCIVNVSDREKNLAVVFHFTLMNWPIGINRAETARECEEIDRRARQLHS